MKKCNNPTCKSINPTFNKDKSKKDGLSSRCRECRKEEQKYYREKTKKLKEFGNYNCKYCGIEFKKKLYNQLFCCVDHQLKYAHEKEVKLKGGKHVIKLHYKAKRKIDSKKATSGRKHYSKKDIDILLSDKFTTKEKSKLLNRTPLAINSKIREIKKQDQNLNKSYQKELNTYSSSLTTFYNF